MRIGHLMILEMVLNAGCLLEPVISMMAASVVAIGYWILNFEAINYRTGAETELERLVTDALDVRRSGVGP